MKKFFIFFTIIVFGYILTSCKPSDVQVQSENIINPKGLCIYYGYPSLVNNANGNLNKAISEFAKFDLIVFGDGLSEKNHPDNTNTKEIIRGLINQKKLVFGYVDLGVSTNNYSLKTLMSLTDNWKQMGVSGIFFDDAGYDYKVTRDRQNEVIKYCKSQNLKVFMNAWNPDDVMSSPTLMNKDDMYLAESFLVGHDKYLPLNDWKMKADKCLDYTNKLGVKIACVATGGENINADFDKSQKYSLAWVGTAMYNFHYFQATNYLYSSNNSIVYAFPNFINDYGSKWNSTIVKQSDGHYYRQSDKNILNIYGNGIGQGYGEIR